MANPDLADYTQERYEAELKECEISQEEFDKFLKYSLEEKTFCLGYIKDTAHFTKLQYCPECKKIRRTNTGACGCGNCKTCDYRWCCIGRPEPIILNGGEIKSGLKWTFVTKPDINHFKITEPNLIKGGLSVDDRGSVSFVNDFNFAGVKRSYLIENHKVGFVRAWHYHAKEAKYVRVLRGTIVFGIVNPHDGKTAQRFVLSAQSPSVLYVPPGNANGFMSLTEDNLVEFYSTATVEESKADDVRYPARQWDIWQIEER